MKNYFEDRREETGEIFQTRFFGTPTVNPKFLLAFDKIPQAPGRKRAALDLYKEHYLDDPLSPNAEAFKDLRIAVAESLGIEGGADEKNLRAYSTLKTPIDVWFGTDGFLEYTNPETGMTARMTIDVTINRRKGEERQDMKADYVIVGPLEDAVQDTPKYLAQINEFAKEIADELKDRTSPRYRKAA